MNFRRTSPGLTNLHLFVGVDLIVFTEGGTRTISKENAMRGDFQASAIDIVFWRALFKWVKPDLELEFRALGSKKTLREIACDISEKKVRNVCVTMDRDFDGHFSTLIKSSNVVYTRSYSWENDVFHADVIGRAFYSVALVDKNVVRVRNEINTIMNRAISNLKWLVYADALLCVGGGSLFDRRNLGGVVSAGVGSPYVRRAWLYSEFRQKRLKVGKFRLTGKPVKLCPKRDCCGKVLLVLSYKILCFLIKKHTVLPNLPKHYAHILLIEQFRDWLAAHPGSVGSKYYFGQISKVSL